MMPMKLEITRKKDGKIPINERTENQLCSESIVYEKMYCMPLKAKLMIIHRVRSSGIKKSARDRV